MAELTLKQVLMLDGLTPNKAASTDKETHYGCPVCGSQNDPDSDRLIYTESNDKVWCRQCDKGANHPIGYVQWVYKDQWRDHARRLGIQLTGYSNGSQPNISKVDLSKAPANAVTIVTPPDLPDVSAPAKLTYINLNDFCENKVGIPLWFATDTLRWEEIKTKDGQPAVKMKMDDGSYRVRALNTKTFIQIPAPGHDPKKSNPAAWYMFPANDKKLIVLCNGQTSVAIAKFYNLDAFCFTDGEKAIPNHLLKRIKARFNANSDTVCIVALDGDNAGRKATEAITQQLAGYPIRVVDFGGQNGYDLGDFCRRYKTKSLEMLKKLSRRPITSQVRSSHETSRGMFARLTRSERFPTHHEYIPIPFKSFHKFGGMMKVLHPRKVAVIGAISGGGKTSIAETWVDVLLRLGFDVLWRGDEWDEDEYDVRRKQRYGGMTMEQYADNEMWETEKAYGVPASQRNGKQLPKPIETKSLQIGKMVESWPGKVWYYPPDPKDITIERTQEQMKTMLHWLRREGRRPALVVWDYLSSFRSRSSDENNQAENVMHSIKQFANTTGLATLALSQVLKSTEDRIKSGEKLNLSSSDLYYVRPDKANLIIGLNPVYYKSKDENGESVTVFTNRVRAEILKNSLGKPYGHVMLKAKLSRFAFEELNN